MSTVKIGVTTHENRHVDTYVATTGEKFEIYETFDLMNEMFIEVFPYSNGELRKFSLAKSKSLTHVKEIIEQFLNDEAKRKAERLASADPVKEAFSKGCKDGKANKDFDQRWFNTISADEQEAYQYAFSKHSN